MLCYAALAAMLKDTGLFPTDALSKAVATFQSKKIADVNLKAVSAGAELVAS